ncbi:hypothetical protein GCM10010466_21400 [Planomonospora alba]|uniref:Uncharacterized protein n=1 Tax=Planomonospora alba TaxID=161354 RepID=A0ABP6MYL0_9ACTN
MRRPAGSMALISAVTALTALGTGTATAAAGRPATERAEKPEKAVTGVVKGWGRIDYADPDDDVRFTVDATVTYPPGTIDPFAGEVRGTARVYHHFANAPTPITVWADISVDCVMIGGRSATVTGIVTAASAHNANWTGQRVGFSVVDNGAGRFDRIGWSGLRMDGDPELRRCTAPAPFFTVKEGGYTVKDVSLFPR